MQMLLSPIVAPEPKIMVDHGPWREVVGEQPPGTAAPSQVPEGIENFTFRIFLRPAPGFGRGHEMLNQFPFLIREVNRVWLSGFHASICTPSCWPSRDFFNTL
jgi:hypothetical protein